MSVDEFFRCLRKSKLLTKEQLRAVKNTIQNNDKATAENLSDSLVKQGVLTEWQGRMLLQKQTGFVLDQYRLLEPIGRGGMGKVFRCEDSRLKRIVAVKVMSKKVARNEKLVRRFRREIEVASKLKSPHIVRTIDAGQVGSSHFMVMEYVDGEGMDDVADRLGRLHPGHACELIRQAAIGLQHAHEHGMVHRDVKPANLMLAWSNDKPIVRILDMGLARIGEPENDGMTRTGQVMGTPEYMAPEQAWNTSDVDIRADIYGLGCTLFRLIAGTVPFQGDNPLQVLMARCSADAPPVATLVPDIDAAINDVVSKMTARDPAARYQTPNEAAAALAEVSEVPTVQSLPESASGADGVSQGELSTQDGAATQAEPSFREFLKDMDSGAAVSLLTTPEAATRPAGNSAENVPTVATKRRRSRKRSRGWPIVAGAVGAVIVVGVGAMMLSGKDKKEPNNDKGHKIAKKQPDDSPPVIVKGTPHRIEAGQALAFGVLPRGAGSELDGIDYALSEDAPDGAEIDKSSGEFFWVPPRTFPPGKVTVTVLARRGNKLVAHSKFEVTVTAAPLTAKFVRPETASILTIGTPFKQKLELFGQDAGSSKVRFRLAGQPPEGVTLDDKTGELAWTAPESAAGRHSIHVELVDPDGERVIDTARFALVVRRPARMVTLPEREAEAGKELRLNLLADFDGELPRGTRWRLVDSSAPGARIVPRTGEFVWTPPEDARGPQVFRVVAITRAGTVGSARFRVNVVAPKRTVVSRPTIPAAGEISEAEKQIRELYKKEFGLRTSRSKSALARKLLDGAQIQNDRAWQYAMLTMAMSLAKESRDYTTGLTICRELGREFGIDSVEQTAELVDEFRTRGLSTVDRLLSTEALWDQAIRGVNDRKFAASRKIVEAVESLVRVGRGTELKPNVKQAIALLDKLPQSDDADLQLSQGQQLAHKELIEVLAPYEYVPLFRDLDAVNFVSHPTNQGVEDRGRSMWTAKHGRVVLEPEASNGLVTGFVDPARTVSSFRIRLMLDSASTTGVLVLGLPADQAGFRGYQIPLSGAEFLHVKQAGEARSVAAPRGKMNRSDDGWDFLEVTIQNQEITVYLNGTRALESRLPESPQGLVGVIVRLTPGTPKHRFGIRDARMRELRE